jgi:anti-sigma regulatory factor (Ser/Thr protein kinase)
MRVREDLGQLLRQAGIHEKTASALVLAVDEAVTALIHYAREVGSRCEMKLDVEVDSSHFKATLTDPKSGAEGVPPYEQNPSDWKYKFGFYLVCKVMDKVSFSYKRGTEHRLELLKIF